VSQPGVFSFESIPDDVRERLNRNWDSIPGDVRDRLLRAGFKPPTPQQPAGTRQDLYNDIREAGQTAGRVALDYGPEAVGSGVGEAVLGPLGSGAGGVLGRSATTLLKEGRLPTPKDAASTFAANTAAPLVARGALRLGRAVLGSSGDDALRLLEDATQANVPMSAGEFNPTMARVQGGLDKLPTAGGIVENLDQAQNAALADYVRDSIVRPLGGPTGMSAVGREVQEEAIPALRTVKGRAHKMYGVASKEATAAGVQVDVPNAVLDAAETAVRQLDEAGIPPAQQGRARAILDSLVARGKPQQVDTGILGTDGKPIVRTVMPGPMPFRELEALQRDLRNVLPAYAQAGQTTSFDVGTLERIGGLIDDAMEQAVVGTPAEEPLRRAKDFYKTEVVPMRQAVSAINGRNVTPDQAVDLLVRNRRPDRLRTMLDHLPPEQSSAVRAGWFQSAIEQCTDPSTGQFSPQRFLTRWHGLGKDVQELITGGQGAEVGRAVRLMRGVQARREMTKNPSRTAIGVGSLTQLAGGGELVRDVAAGNLTQAAGDMAAFLAPPAMARILATPGAARYFAIGLTAPPGSSQARQALDTLTAVVGQVGAGAATRAGGMAARDTFLQQPGQQP